MTAHWPRTRYVCVVIYVVCVSHKFSTNIHTQFQAQCRCSLLSRTPNKLPFECRAADRQTLTGWQWLWLPCCIGLPRQINFLRSRNRQPAFSAGSVRVQDNDDDETRNLHLPAATITKQNSNVFLLLQRGRRLAWISAGSVLWVSELIGLLAEV